VGIGRVIAVSDAGPLIHLSEINCLSVLSVFEGIHIPEAVCSEVIRHRGKSVMEDIRKTGSVRCLMLSQNEVSQFISNNNLEKLDYGERECLYLCMKTGIKFLLTDDMAVRESCEKFRLTPIGSLGIVIRACRIKLISLSQAEKYMSDLYDVSSLFVTETIVRIAIEQLRRKMV